MLDGPARCPVCVQGQMAQSTPLPIPASYTNQERGAEPESKESTLIFCPDCRMM
jgi:hypothetical protein